MCALFLADISHDNGAFGVRQVGVGPRYFVWTLVIRRVYRGGH